MIAVSDTSPLCYLILIDEVDLLPKHFEQVVLPRMVQDELLHEDAPKVVRAWAADLPSWVVVHENPVRTATPIAKLQASAGSHVIFSVPGLREIVSVPAKRPIKPVYIKQFLALIDAAGEVGKQ